MIAKHDITREIDRQFESDQVDGILEGDLLTLVVAEAATVGAAATTSASTTAASISKATTSSTTTATTIAEASTTTATAEATATATSTTGLAIGGTWLAVVKSAIASANVLTVHGFEGCCSLLLG